MKVFKITASNVDYDEFDSCVVVAESKEKALKLIGNSNRAEDDVYVYFNSCQTPLIVKEIDIGKEHIVDSSYNAG